MSRIYVINAKTFEWQNKGTGEIKPVLTGQAVDLQNSVVIGFFLHGKEYRSDVWTDSVWDARLEMQSGKNGLRINVVGFDKLAKSVALRGDK